MIFVFIAMVGATALLIQMSEKHGRRYLILYSTMPMSIACLALGFVVAVNTFSETPGTFKGKRDSLTLCSRRLDRHWKHGGLHDLRLHRLRYSTLADMLGDLPGKSHLLTAQTHLKGMAIATTTAVSWWSNYAFAAWYP